MADFILLARTMNFDGLSSLWKKVASTLNSSLDRHCIETLFSAVMWIEWFFRNSSASSRAATVSK